MSNLSFYSFTSSKKEGQMNTNKKFYPKDLTRDEIINMMENNKKKLAERVGFDWHKLFIPSQKSNNNPKTYNDGHTLLLTNGIVNSYSNLYDYNYECDIVKITRKTPYVAIAYPMADCAVITAVNLKTEEAVMAHCGGEHINRYLPMQLIDSLGGNEEDIRVHISPFAHNLHYPHHKPDWISNEIIWDNCLNYNLDGLFINQLQALKNMLMKRKIDLENLYIYPFDTTKDQNFYSNSNEYNGKTEDAGRQIAGVVLINNKKYENDQYMKKFK